jgi:hypothetical protein
MVRDGARVFVAVVGWLQPTTAAIRGPTALVMVISFQRGLVVIGLRRPAGDMSAGSQPQP